jgi:hypothetical protein
MLHTVLHINPGHAGDVVFLDHTHATDLTSDFVPPYVFDVCTDSSGSLHYAVHRAPGDLEQLGDFGGGVLSSLI